MTRPLLGPAFLHGSARLRDLTPVQREVRDQIVASNAPTDYEECATCLCGEVGNDLPLAEVDRHGVPSRQVLCRACGLIRLSPRWREERYRRFYEEEYRALYNPIVTSKAEFAQQAADGYPARDIARWISAVHARHGRSRRPVVVELGAGAGWNLANLPASWERIAYDVDHSYLELASRLFGVAAKWGYIDDALADVARADLILLSHLVEHLLDPEDALRTIRSAIREEGLLLIEVPGIFRIHRSRLDVMAYMQNAHVYTFCAETLGATCLRAGFEVLELDETVRAVCSARGRGNPAPAPLPRPGLWRRVLRYLRWCERGYATLIRLRGLPVVGRYCGWTWKKLYFPALGLVVPRRPTRRAA